MPRNARNLLYQLVIIPLWASYLVRGYAWKTILGSDGVLNGLLQYLHITHHPVEFFLYSPFAVILTLTHIYTPFTFLPIYASLEHIPAKFGRGLARSRRFALVHFSPRDFAALASRRSRRRHFRISSSRSEISSRRCWSAAPAES